MDQGLIALLSPLTLLTTIEVDSIIDTVTFIPDLTFVSNVF